MLTDAWVHLRGVNSQTSTRHRRRCALPAAEKGTVHEPQATSQRCALVFMLIYLVFMTLIWLNAYLRLWLKG